jgi:hypothetical protein
MAIGVPRRGDDQQVPGGRDRSGRHPELRLGHVVDELRVEVLRPQARHRAQRPGELPAVLDPGHDDPGLGEGAEPADVVEVEVGNDDRRHRGRVDAERRQLLDEFLPGPDLLVEPGPVQPAREGSGRRRHQPGDGRPRLPHVDDEHALGVLDDVHQQGQRLGEPAVAQDRSVPQRSGHRHLLMGANDADGAGGHGMHGDTGRRLR